MKGIQGTSNKTWRQLMGNGLRYEIPKFQRDYSWDTEQWDDLWQDIQALLHGDETEHYMGYLVLQTSDNRQFLVIDGQQRLTTLSILTLATLRCLKALIDQGTDTDKNQTRYDSLMNSYIGYVDPVTLISYNKLKLNRNSDDYYRQYIVLLRDPLPLRNTNASEKGLRACFLWYHEKISRAFDTGEALARFIDALSDKLFFTVIEVTDQLNAFKVFETLNARGIQLSAADLLKNYLFSVVDNAQPSAHEIEELENLWGKITDKLGEQKFEDFLRHYWNSAHKLIGKKELYKAIRQHIQTKQEAFTLIRELEETADTYLAIQNPEDELWQNRPELIKALKVLQLFQIRQTYSLFLAGFKHLSESDFEKLVKTCAVISFRYNIIGGLNPNEQEIAYNKAALYITRHRAFNLADFAGVYVNDDNFENDFSSKVFKNTSRNHKIVKYILAKLEKRIYRHDIDPESDYYTIEHILPENADTAWGDFSDEAISRCVYRLGNLTLLEKTLNRDAGTLPYEAKKAYYQQSSSQLTQALPRHYDTWNEAKLAARQKELARHAKGEWSIPGL